MKQNTRKHKEIQGNTKNMLLYSFFNGTGPRLLAVIVVALTVWPLTGCGNKSQEGKTPEMEKAFKGGPPPPEVQREIDKTMAQLNQKGRPQTPTPH